MTDKECTTCKETKPFKDFCKSKLGKGGVDSRCKPCKNLSSKAHYRDKLEYHRERKWMQNFGITSERYYAMLESQGGVCGICGQTDGDRFLAIDHCHETGNIRGLLCNNCNRGIGHLKDDLKRLESAIKYLKGE